MGKQLREDVMQYHRQAPAGNGIAIGSILLGANKPVHILTPAFTMRRIVNMSAVAAAGV